MTTKFTCHAALLKRALAFAMMAHERRNTIAILGMARIDAADGSVRVQITDLDMTATARVDAEVEAPFSFTANPILLSRLVAYAESLTVTRDGDMITIAADDMVATIREVCPVADWPDMKLGDAAGLPVSIAEAALNKALRLTSICISTEETRYYLNGVYLHNTDKGLRMVATDGHRMAVYDTGAGWGLPSCILPRKAAAILQRAVGKGGNSAVEVMSFVTGKDGAPIMRFAGDDWSLQTKTINGTFPDYTRVIPKFSEATVTATITSAGLRRLPNMGERSQAVMINCATGRMSVRDGYRLMGGKDTSDIVVTAPVQTTGDVTLGFNLKYLLPFANVAGTIRVETISKGDPARVVTDDPALQWVLMPMRV